MKWVKEKKIKGSKQVKAVYGYVLKDKAGEIIARVSKCCKVQWHWLIIGTGGFKREASVDQFNSLISAQTNCMEYIEDLLCQKKENSHVIN